ncbi:MAG TPA: thiamine pyrophosphate-dependent dehydrogenase E1 component subunit alpha, partial [Candidatus Sulfotelmatobacter sp.]|nr:thiamine pyrophosphate-dependent dehydrogenase E1 component subunit alpha [Candidatus Sulfotelmatobacter sp.]
FTMNGLELPREILLRLYSALRLTRALEERLGILYRQGKILGGVYLSTGQEAVSVGAAAALEDGDVIIPSHRDMGAHLLRGIQPREVFAQFLGRVGGPSRGRDGNVHFGDLARGDVAFLSPMADGIPVAVGVALALQRQDLGRIAMTWFGEGAASRGDFHEGINLSAVLRVPVVFVCNNNQYAYSTPLARQTAVPDIAARAAGYGIPGCIVDGTDVVAVYRAAREAVARARQGGGPSLVECKAMRLRGHSEHDDASYVPRDVLESWRARDPVDGFERRLLEAGILDGAERKTTMDRIRMDLEEALAWAEASPLPDPAELVNGVYST